MLKQKKRRGLPRARRSGRIASNTKRGETANTRRDKNGIYEKAEEERERERASVPGPKPGIGNLTGRISGYTRAFAGQVSREKGKRFWEMS